MDIMLSSPLLRSVTEGEGKWYMPDVFPSPGSYECWVETPHSLEFVEHLAASPNRQWNESRMKHAVRAWRHRRGLRQAVTVPPWLVGNAKLPDSDGWYRREYTPNDNWSYEVWLATPGGIVEHISSVNCSEENGWDIVPGSAVLAWRAKLGKILVTQPAWVAGYTRLPDVAGWYHGYVIPNKDSQYDIYVNRIGSDEKAIFVSHATYTKAGGWAGYDPREYVIHAWRLPVAPSKPAWVH